MSLTKEDVDKLRTGDVVILPDCCYLIVEPYSTVNKITIDEYLVIAISDVLSPTNFKMCHGVLKDWRANFIRFGTEIINIDNLYNVIKANS